MTSHVQLKYSYIALAVCVITSSIPLMAMQSFAMGMSIVLIVSFYIMRRKWATESFEHKEASAIIKTFWLWSLIYVVGVMVAGAVISSLGDMTAMNEWTESIVQGTAVPDEAGMKQATEEFMEKNFPFIISMTILSILPAQIYAAIRIKQGLKRLKNPPVTPPDAIIG